MGNLNRKMLGNFYQNEYFTTLHSHNWKNFVFQSKVYSEI